jgi:hypothetical protein
MAPSKKMPERKLSGALVTDDDVGHSGNSPVSGDDDDGQPQFVDERSVDGDQPLGPSEGAGTPRLCRVCGGDAR